MADGLEPSDLAALARGAFDEAVDIRRALHAAPELAFVEHRTTTLVRDRLRRLGLSALHCPTATGAVVQLDTGRPGRTVLLRADIDALPLEEETDLRFRSRTEGVMHACGHDAHVAILLSVAAVLAQRAESLSGRFVFLFQPAEELCGGARAMVEGGVLDSIAADSMLAFHVVSMMPTGIVAARPGIAMSAADVWTIRILGTGGHGALASADGNVVLAASALAQALPAVTAGMTYEDVRCACSAGVIQAGAAPNVVPRSAKLCGTLRTFTPAQRTDAFERLRGACREISERFRVSAELVPVLDVPPVINDPAITERAHAAITALGGPIMVTPPPVAPSDDASEFMNRVPGCYLFVGAAPEGREGPPPFHHAPDFDIDERSIEIGTQALAAAAIALTATA